MPAISQELQWIKSKGRTMVDLLEMSSSLHICVQHQTLGSETARNFVLLCRLETHRTDQKRPLSGCFDMAPAQSHDSLRRFSSTGYTRQTRDLHSQQYTSLSRPRARADKPMPAACTARPGGSRRCHAIAIWQKAAWYACMPCHHHTLGISGP